MGLKEIKAFIREKKLGEVAKYLKQDHFCCFTVFKREGVGDYVDPEEQFPSLRFPFLHQKIIKIEIVCNAMDVDTIIKVIREHAKTGKSGDGLIYVSSVDYSIKIRNGEHSDGKN